MKLLKTSAHRWGEGKIHRVLYSKLNRVYYPACRQEAGTMFHGKIIEGTANQITCKKCV